MNNSEERTLVIVGGVAGGASAATRARRANEKAKIVLFEKDAHVSFANCGLPYYIGGEIEDRGKLLVATPKLFEERFNIEVKTGHEVLSIDRENRTVNVRNLAAGTSFDQPYDRLILAPGASPIIPPLEGVEAQNVFTIRNLADTDRLKERVEDSPPRKVVIVGAGFIGLELAEQLHRLGSEIHLIDLADQVLAPLDPEMAHMVQEELEERGVVLHLGDGLGGFRTEDGLATGVELSSGTILETDLVALGIGVRPNTKLASEAGLEIGPMRGIAVDEWQRTTDPAIYAVGDAVEYKTTYLDSPLPIALGGPANRSGRIAGEHAASDRAAPMGPVHATAVVRVFGKTAATTGLSTKLADRLGIETKSVAILANHHAGYFPGAEGMFLKLVYAPDTGKLLGAQAVGGEGVDKRLDVLSTALRFGATVRDLTELDLAYAPPFGSAKDPIHMAAFAATNELDGLTRFVPVDEDLENRQVVDVRTDKEWNKFRLPEAIHIPVDEIRDRLDELDPSRPTVVVCHSGLRAHIASRVLTQNGFEKVSVLSGGMALRRHARGDSIVYANAPVGA